MILDCKKFAEELENRIIKGLQELKEKPKLLIIISNLIDDNSKQYCNSILKLCDKFGISYNVLDLDKINVFLYTKYLQNLLSDLEEYSGIFIPLSSYTKFDETTLLLKKWLSPYLDIDGITSFQKVLL